MSGISLRLFKGMMVLVAVIVAVLWLFQVVFLEDFYSSRQIGLMQDKVNEIAAQIGEKGIDDPKLQEEIAEFSDVYNVIIGVFDSSGVSVYEAGGETSTGTQNFFDKHIMEVVTEALNGSTVNRTEEQTRTGGRFLFLATPTGSGALAAAVPLAPVSDTASILKVQLAYITVILLVVSFVLSYVLSGRFVKPILKITDAARKMAKGDFDVDLDVKGNDEISALARDMKEMGIELGRTERLKKDLIGNISHELRTPLSLIRGYAETLRDVSGNDLVRRNRQLGIIMEESDRLSELVDDILSMSRLDSGASKPEPASVDMKELANRVSERFRDLSSRTGIRLLIEAESDCRITADPKLMTQVSVNLIGNAFKHARENVLVSVSRNEGLVTLMVDDDGNGISDEDLPRIWDRYYKGKGEGAAGTGLGLAIAKSILESHGFKYGASNNDSGGARFWFSAKSS
ncbi:sensor histidine kinase [Youngiibacter fragilis]|uniref:histidine kinase n=1 Tax=Youngiibacter fragilis 232.1 TaxID=994573 RepID=V7I9F4_9CLOT|nr:HAMP domain-containing sensor histidine kinase [Youngiibacter fragilis]ETA81911.1 histidine kinase [Youngiibacter fragilis 232.1]